MHRRQALRLRRTVARLRSLTAVPRQEFGINAVVADSSPALAGMVFTSGGTVRNVQSQLSQIIAGRRFALFRRPGTLLERGSWPASVVGPHAGATGPVI